MTKKESLSKKVEKLNLDANIDNLESSVKELGDSCTLIIKNILHTNMKKAYSLLSFKKEMYSYNGDYPTLPELHILDRKDRETVYEIDFGYNHGARLNKDYKGELRKKGYLDSINKLLKSIGYKVSEDSFHSRRGGCGSKGTS